jgi:hypothetical protein
MTEVPVFATKVEKWGVVAGAQGAPIAEIAVIAGIAVIGRGKTLPLINTDDTDRQILESPHPAA